MTRESYFRRVHFYPTTSDIFWLKDDALEDSATLPAPDVLALEITENLQAALTQFASIADELEIEA